MIKRVIFLLCCLCSDAFAEVGPQATRHTPAHWFSCLINPQPSCLANEGETLDATEILLREKNNQLSSAVIDKVLAVLSCSLHRNPSQLINHLTIIDYSLPSNKKRLWIFDLNQQKRLFHTYVSHGLKSGQLMSDSFSNKNDSKSSSIGVFKTDKPYYGRHGISLKLQGLEPRFNDNVANRAIVMHGAWYAEEPFIKKYGRAGRSWGCPAVPDIEVKPIIEAIQENSLLVVYYPHDEWLSRSNYLHCNTMLKENHFNPPKFNPDNAAFDVPQSVVFVDVNNNKKHEEQEPVIAISADDYALLIKQPVPLARMLRRPINQQEYIVLNRDELARLSNQEGTAIIQKLKLVVPEIKMEHGYYATNMKVIQLGSIKQFTMDEQSTDEVDFSNRSSLKLHSINHFIRWIGL